MDFSQIKPVSHYEELRESILQQQPVDLGCFLKRGFLGWITFNKEKDSQLSPIFYTSGNLLTTPNTNEPSRTEIVPILSAIIIHHYKGKGDRHVNINSPF